MEAGFGAEEQASRRARRAAEKRKELAAGEAAGSAVAAELERIQRQQRAWSQGAEGERQVAAALEPLAQFGWTTLHDVHWPGRPQANIDHIAVGPGGVVIVDAKNWTGAVTLHNGALRQNGYAREREVEGVAQATAAVTVLLAPEHRASTRAVICLAGQDQDPVTVGPGVTVVGRLQLAAWLATLPARLSPYDVADLGRHLHGLLGGPTTPTLPPLAAFNRAIHGGAGAPPPPVQTPGRGPRNSGAKSRRSQSGRAGRAPADKEIGRGAALLRFGLCLIAAALMLNLLFAVLRGFQP